MNYKEAGEIKKKFIQAKQDALYKATSRAEQILLNAIFDELFKEIGKSNGTILDDSGKGLKLSTAIKKVFDKFNQTTNLSIINEISTTLMSLGTLNKEYFKTFGKSAELLRKAFSDADKAMMNRVGIAADGKLIEGGYLFTLLNDSTLRDNVSRETQKAFGNKVTLSDYMKTIRDIVVGDESKSGGLTHHYRTFAHDTYSQFASEYADNVATTLSLDCAVYEGGVIETTRDFCRKKSGKVFTRSEIRAFSKDPDLLLTKDEKKAGGPKDYVPERDKGRWNCRHYYNWIPDDVAIRLRPSLKRVPRSSWS